MSRDDRRKDFINRYKHELAGLVFDAVTSRDRTGPELALWSRQMMQRIDKRIGEMFDDLLPSPTPPLPAEPAKPANGTAATTPPTRKPA